LAFFRAKLDLFVAWDLGEDCFQPALRRRIAGLADHELNGRLGESAQRRQLSLDCRSRMRVTGTTVSERVNQSLAIFRRKRFRSAHENSDSFVRGGIDCERQQLVRQFARHKV
jgi:hypothetical protein